MKRLIKKTNRKGFTLVETLLATFILVIISTMLINGFIATMGYSFQTSVYSKSGANNYAACMEKVATWNTLEDRGTTGRQKALETATGVKQMTFVCPPGTSMKTLYVGVESQYTLDNTVPATLPFQSAAFAPRDGKNYGSSDQMADNRKAVYYYPEYWRGSASTSKYKIGVRIDEDHKDTNGNPRYEWVVLPTYEVAEDYDLSGLSGNDVIGSLTDSHKSFK
ncbi:MAG: prepilin-type N-terminal cleavage/methylation domain-containing protein [Saccharofermentans sp.]|nr:prepilin-type N-terminal cleavage/methylation domain-containing protein [Saccharofermentans sp.]